MNPETGLSSAEAASRLEQYGPNRFAEAAPEPQWQAFLRQYNDPMQIVLLVAGIGSIWPLSQYGTGAVLLFLTVFNAVLGMHQEGKAAAAVAALQKMMIIKAKVRRDGELVVRSRPRSSSRATSSTSRPATSCRPTGGCCSRATLEIAESALTGESVPVSKDTEVVAGARRAARRPDRHGVHEHERHPRQRAS